MLPDDYPDDFSHDALQGAWFQGVPWAVQRRVMDVDALMRVVRNPVTQVFVVVLKLLAGDPAVHPFFGETKLRGWLPLAETRRGQPVEFLYQMCEGMEASRRFFNETYGTTPETIEKGLKQKHVERATAKDLAMAESTAFARKFAEDFFRKHFGVRHTNAPIYIGSPRVQKLIKKAREELADAMAERQDAEDRKANFSLVTT